MVNYLVGIHAGLGEIGAFLFLWLFVELLNPSKSRIKRAKIVAVLGTIFIFLSWFAGGYSYVTNYGTNVKPLIKAGPSPWAHSIFTESKEHIFLFLPFLSILVSSMIFAYGNKLETDKKARSAALILSITIVLIALLMAGMGYLISTGARTALEAKIL